MSSYEIIGTIGLLILLANLSYLLWEIARDASRP